MAEQAGGKIVGKIKGKIVDDFIIPATYARAFVVKKGQVLTIIEVEGKQMVDATFLNANDHREVFHAGMTVAINMMNGEGTMQRVTRLYSKPPRDNVMLTVIDDPVGVHLAWNGGRCSRKFYENFAGMKGHRSCQDNLAEALAPFGLGEDDVPDVFNAFMNAGGIEEGRFETLLPASEKGDYISLRAEMDILAAVSACPFDLLYTPKPLQIQIIEPE
ncbi:MAG TPA: urea carboxylase-associated family protein [Blastocatellia bacterium]|nr:urea carboxylase-associated family protein [Blastocatellia bacterium]